MSILEKIQSFFTDPYLLWFWLLLLGLVVGCWVLAFAFSRINIGKTIVHSCHTAWGISLGLHCLTSLSVLYFWYQKNGVFDQFWPYASCYIALAVVSGILAVISYFSGREFADYHEA